MIYLPIYLNITDQSILIIGGGKIAWQKITMLRQFTDKLTVIAPEIDERIKSAGLPYKEKEYETSDLEGSTLVYACTNRTEINRIIKEEANKAGLLVNVTDNKALCDFITPAIFKQDYMTVAVSSNGRDIKRTRAWRDRIRELFNHDSTDIDKP